MIRRRHDRDQDPARIANGKQDIEELPESALAHLSRLEGSAEDAGMVEDGRADAEGIAEMHGWHGGEGVDVFPAHPDGFGFIASDAVEEAVFAR